MMTDELRERIVELAEEFAITGMAPVVLANRILALLPPMPKLEWRERPGDWFDLQIGDLQIAHICEEMGNWYAWIGDARQGWHPSQEHARAAVEAKVKAAARLSTLRTPCDQTAQDTEYLIIALQRDVKLLQSQLAAGPVMPEVPQSELVLDELSRVMSWERAIEMYADIRTALLKEQSR